MEWLNKITNPLAERVKSPLYGSFIISWLIWNWRVALTVLFPNQSKFGKLTLVEYVATNYM